MSWFPFQVSIDALSLYGALSIVLDVVLVAILIYWILLLVRGTRGQNMLLGLVIVGVFYVMSRKLGLVTLNWLLGNFLGSVILVVVVLFQDDLRRGLVKVGLFPSFSPNLPEALEETIRHLSRAAAELSARKIGALMVLRRDVGLDEYSEHAVRLDARISDQLLVSIFQKTSPLHDGAVLIEGDRIIAAGAVLPLTFEAPSSGYGTRHRAALGLSEVSDAVVIVVSEETGNISLVREGRISSELDERSLYNALFRLTLIRHRRRQRQWQSLFSRDSRTRAVASPAPASSDKPEP